MGENKLSQKEEKFKRIDVEIRGLTPLLMNRLNPESLKTKSRMRTQDYSTATDALNSAYKTEAGDLFIPQECVYSMIIGTAKQYRIKRTTLSSLLAGTMRVEPAQIMLGTKKYEIDERAVVIQNQRILKGRARIPLPWAVKFQLVLIAKYMPDGIEPTLQEMLEDAGVRMGLLDYRPQHKGWFGTFEVASFVPVIPTYNSTTAEIVAEEEEIIPEIASAAKKKTKTK